MTKLTSPENSVLYAGANAQTIMDNAAPEAAMILVRFILAHRGKPINKMPLAVQRACEFIIEQAVGKARQKIEHSGGILTYGMLARAAEQLAKQPREVFIEADFKELPEPEPSPDIPEPKPGPYKNEKKERYHPSHAEAIRDDKGEIVGYKYNPKD